MVQSHTPPQKAIPFVQLIGADRKAVKFMAPEPVAAKAMQIIDAGYRLVVAYFGNELHLTIEHAQTEAIVAQVVYTPNDDEAVAQYETAASVKRLIDGFTPDASIHQEHLDHDEHSGS